MHYCQGSREHSATDPSVGVGGGGSLYATCINLGGKVKNPRMVTREDTEQINGSKLKI